MSVAVHGKFGGTLRVLLVDKGAEAGGSVVSMYQLVAGLDRSRYDAVVLLAEENPYVPRFRALGVNVITRPWANRPPQGSAATKAVSRAPLLQKVRASSWGRTAYHGAGFYAKAFPEILARARAFRTLLRKVRPDIVHLNNTVPINRGEILGGRLAGARLLVHARGFERLNHFDRWLSGMAQQYIFISRAVRDDFLRERGRVRAHEVVYNGVDARALQADAAEGVAFRSQIGIPPDARVATMLGRIIGWKGQHVFVAAMRALASEDPNVYGLIVGGAEFFSEEYARQVDAQVRDSGFDNRIRLCGYRDDIAAVLAASDVVVHASLEPEAFGRVIIEAMAAGRPVVGSMVGGVPELIEDGVSGLLVPPNDAARLARAVRRILDDRDLARRLAEGGLKRVREDFDIRLHLERVSKIYEAMVC